MNTHIKGFSLTRLCAFIKTESRAKIWPVRFSLSPKVLLYLIHLKELFNLSQHTVKPVLSGHLKIDKTKILKKNGSLMKVESIAECSLGAFCNTSDLH